MNKGTILIFKDESDNQEILKVSLRSMKYKILDAPEGERDQEILVVITGYLDKELEASNKPIGCLCAASVLCMSVIYMIRISGTSCTYPTYPCW